MAHRRSHPTCLVVVLVLLVYILFVVKGELIVDHDICGTPGGDAGIICNDGFLNEFPWMALLSYTTDNGPKFKCGGTVIKDEWILTAAHCVSNLKQPLLGVRVGGHKIITKNYCHTGSRSNECSEPVQDLNIEKVFPHPGFNVTVIKDDIALLKVAKMNLNTGNVKPVCLPTEDAKHQAIKDATITGWGITGTGQGNNVLKKFILPVLNQEKCKSIYKANPRVRITEKQICVSAKNKKGFCPGDSGGPLITMTLVNDKVRFVQQGIMSFGPKQCGLEDFPGVYTRVASYMDWILKTIEKD